MPPHPVGPRHAAPPLTQPPAGVSMEPEDGSPTLLPRVCSAWVDHGHLLGPEIPISDIHAIQKVGAVALTLLRSIPAGAEAGRRRRSPVVVKEACNSRRSPPPWMDDQASEATG